jgi:hypothetical protein
VISCRANKSTETGLGANEQERKRLLRRRLKAVQISASKRMLSTIRCLASLSWVICS